MGEHGVRRVLLVNLRRSQVGRCLDRINRRLLSKDLEGYRSPATVGDFQGLYQQRPGQVRKHKGGQIYPRAVNPIAARFSVLVPLLRYHNLSTAPHPSTPTTFHNHR